MKIEKLELKHLAPYLPYGLKDVKYYDGFTFNGEVTVLNVMNYVYKDTSAKIVLHPLSDLTKHCEDLGFVPIYELLNSKEGDFLVKERFGKIQATNRIEIWTNPEHVDITGENIPSQYVEGIFTSSILAHSYNRVIKLHEWHFDVFGLIESGLAIDVNTLETNPYA